MQVGVLLRGRYEVVRSIKSGGMGSVCEARDTSLANSPCAIKEVLDSALAGPNSEYISNTFEKEMKALVELDHPSIPKVRDYFQDGDKRYIVMEFVKGRSLEEEIAEHKETTSRGLPPGKAVADILQLLETVTYLHHLRPPIVHRDIKPANIIRDDKTGRIKLVDFGLAKAHSETCSPQTMVGTMGYCAPEQLSGKPEPRSDLYSVGATLYQMLTTRIPQLSFDPLVLDMQGLRPGLDRIVAKATQPVAGDRYNRAEEMAADLRAWQSGAMVLSSEETSAPPTGQSAAPSSGESSNQWAWFLVAFLCLGAGIGAGVLAGQSFKSTPVPTSTPLPFVSSTPVASASPTPARPSYTPAPAPRASKSPPPRPRQAPRPSPTREPHPTATKSAAPPIQMPRIDEGPAYPEGHPLAPQHKRPHRPATPPITMTNPAPAQQPELPGGFIQGMTAGHMSFSRESKGYHQVVEVINGNLELRPGSPDFEKFKASHETQERDLHALHAMFINNDPRLRQDWQFDRTARHLMGPIFPMRGSKVAGGFCVTRGYVFRITIRPAPPNDELFLECLSFLREISDRSRAGQ